MERGSERTGGGGAFTLNDWDRSRCVCVRVCVSVGQGGQTEMLLQQRQIVNDRCATDNMEGNHEGGGGGEGFCLDRQHQNASPSVMGCSISHRRGAGRLDCATAGVQAANEAI